MTRCHIGRGLLVLAEDDRGISLEGTCRLAPGRQVALYGLMPRPTHPRQAYVTTWRVVRTGKNGMTYRGYCEWRGRGHEPVAVPGRSKENDSGGRV